MMISPESYCEMDLKGKNVEQIMSASAVCNSDEKGG